MIPQNQRGYAWTRKEIVALLRDIERSDKQHVQHYFGPIVVSTKPGSEHRYRQQFWKRKYLEDGQQRLTTLLFLCEALRRRLESAEDCTPSGESDNIKLRDIVRTKGDEAIPPQHILQSETESDNDLLRKLFDEPARPGLVAPTPSAQRLVNAHSFVFDWVSRLESTPEVETWASRLLETGRFFVVDLQQENIDRNLAFNCINSRGLPLSEFDRVKNYCMMIRDRRASQAENSKSGALANLNIPNLWFQAVSALDKFGLGSRRDEGEFLLEMYRSWSGKNTALGDIPSRLEGEFDSLLHSDDQTKARSLHNFIQLWPQFAEAFAVVSADRSSPEIAAAYAALPAPTDGQWLDRFHDLDFVAIARAILSASWIRYDKREFIDIAEACEKFVFRVHAVMRRRTDFQGPARFELAKSILDGEKCTSEVVDALYNLTIGTEKDPVAPLERVVHEIGNRQPKYGYWDQLYYFLFEYEIDLQGGLSSRVYPKGRADLDSQIEHVLPQGYQSKNGWASIWPDQRLAIEAMHRIGNLVHTRDNGALSNKEFPDKIKIYAKRDSTKGEQEIARDRTLSDGKKWDTDSINARENLLMAFAFKRWRFRSQDPSSVQLPHGQAWSNGSSTIDEHSLDRPMA